MSKAKQKDRSLRAIISKVEEEAAEIRAVERETFERIKKGGRKPAAPVAKGGC